MTSQDTERAARSTGTTSSAVPTTAATATNPSNTATGAAEVQTTVSALEDAPLSADDPTVAAAANNGALTPLSGEATVQGDEAGSSSLTGPSTPSTPAPTSATLNDTKLAGGAFKDRVNEMEESGAENCERAESLIEGLDIVTASRHEASAATAQGTQGDHILTAE
ncbi:hypothetical protein DFQ26_000741, partial [Actinomortierella ambigua]